MAGKGDGDVGPSSRAEMRDVCHKRWRTCGISLRDDGPIVAVEGSVEVDSEADNIRGGIDIGDDSSPVLRHVIAIPPPKLLLLDKVSRFTVIRIISDGA